MDALEATRRAVAERGPGALVVDDLRADDLIHLAWTGPLHVKHMGEQLPVVERGESDYLVVRAPTGEPVSKGGVIYVDGPDEGKLWQLATHPALQSLGLGTVLIGALEDRIRGRGRPSAILGVETTNPRARALYERLGYEAYGEEPDGWQQQDADGNVSWYSCVCTLMRKRLDG